MVPGERLQDVTGSYYRELKKRHGLNPFDLFSWRVLTNLWVEMRRAGARGDYEDRDMHVRTRDLLWEALERKAEALDDDDGTEDHVTFLQELRTA